MGMRIPSSGMSQVSGASGWQQQRQAFQQLASALKSGDLDAAKTAFAAVAAKAPSASDPNSPLAQLGKALASGDIGAAQASFSAMRSSGRHHSHGPSAGSGSPSLALATSGSVGTAVNTLA